jgi:RNA polymerase sigma-70 factor (ECF subfamily)
VGGGRGDAERFSALVLPHIDAAYNLARYLCRDATAADDIVQDAFLRAFRGFHGWRGDSPKAWLLAIVRNCFLSAVAARRARPAETDDGIAAAALVEHDTPETLLVRDSEARLVRQMLDALPEPFRETLVLREMEELSYREIALITRVPIGTVMSRLSRGRQMLADQLSPRGDQLTKVRP